MQINVFHNFDQVTAKLKQWHGHIPGATAAALNDTAFAIRKAEQEEMTRVFDRVTPYMRNSVFVEKATPFRLVASIAPEYMGGKGVDPQRVLRAGVMGGQRKDKAAERALQRAGILPKGFQMVPGEAAPLDAYGNIKAGFLVQILSYMRAFGEQGYKANATDRTKARREKRGRTASGYATINGVAYFVAYGKLRDGKGQHLAPGIYSKTGIHGIDIKPVLMFVRRGTYRVRLDYAGVGLRVADETFGRRFRYRYRQAIESRGESIQLRRA